MAAQDQPLQKPNLPPVGVDCLTEPSARAEMTIPSEDRDLLIILASSSTVPSAPVLPTCETHKHGRVLIIMLQTGQPQRAMTLQAATLYSEDDGEEWMKEGKLWRSE